MEELQPDTLGELEQTAEVHPFPRRRSGSAYEQAKQDLAAFKFALFETVAADPLLRGVPCLNLIVVYASLVTIDKRTLQPTTAYASNARIYSRAGLKSHNTAGKARRYLEQYGYIVPVGSNNGITIYRLDNPNIERVQMHIQALDEYRREIRADQKQSWNERKKRMSNNDTPDDERVSEVDTLKNTKGVNNCHPRVSEVDMQGCQEMTPITLKEYLSVIPESFGSEKEGSPSSDVAHGISDLGAVGKGELSEAPTQPARNDPDLNPQEKKNSYAAAKMGEVENSDLIASPSSEQEAGAVLDDLFGAFWNELHPNIQRFARRRLMSGNLTQSWVDARITYIEAENETGDT